MGISGISATTSSYPQGAASAGNSAAEEAKESPAAKLAEQQNRGKAPSANTASQTSSSNSNNNVTKLRKYANEHMPVSQIAQLLGQSVSTIMQEASSAGINLSTGSSSSANPAVGNNVNRIA